MTNLSHVVEKPSIFFSEFAFDKSDGAIIGRVENYDANRVEQIRTNIIKDIKLGEKKRKKEEKKIKVEKVKDTGKSTCIVLRGLREKTFNKAYLRNKLGQFGEIVRISSVVGQARSVMVRFADYKECKNAFKTLKEDFSKIFSRFPKGEVKLVKPDRKKKVSTPVTAFTNLEQKPVYPIVYKY